MLESRFRPEITNEWTKQVLDYQICFTFRILINDTSLESICN